MDCAELLVLLLVLNLKGAFSAAVVQWTELIEAEVRKFILQI